MELVGQILKNKREIKKLTISDVAKELKISQEVLINLENDNLQNDINIVYLLGHLRSYSNFLNLNPKELVKKFKDQQLPIEEKNIEIRKPKVEKIGFSKTTSEEKVLQLIASLNQYSEHPLAKATLNFAKEKDIQLQPTQDFKSITGKGVQGKLENETYFLGNKRLMEENSIRIEKDLQQEILQQQEKGKTVSYLANSTEVLGYVVIGDPIKKSAKKAIQTLHKKGIEVMMLTGDNEQTAKAVAQEIGLDHFKANMLPDGKQQEVERLQKQGKQVAMAGDGINDAPALAAAHVSMSPSSAADISQTAADIVFQGEGLSGVPLALRIAARANRLVKQYFFGMAFPTIC